MKFSAYNTTYEITAVIMIVAVAIATDSGSDYNIT